MDPRRRTALLGGLALVLLAGCVSSVTQSESSGGPTVATPSMTFVEPSEAVEPSEQAAGLSGTWDGTWVIDGYGTSGDYTMELVQSGDAFNGTVEITNTDCSNGFVEGTLDGSTVDFGWLLTPQPVQFTGTLIGSSMSGTWEAIACSNPDLSLTGSWEATRRP